MKNFEFDWDDFLGAILTALVFLAYVGLLTILN